VNLCAIDVSEAFDKVNHHTLYITLVKRHLPVKVINLIENMCSACFSNVKWDSV